LSESKNEKSYVIFLFLLAELNILLYNKPKNIFMEALNAFFKKI